MVKSMIPLASIAEFIPLYGFMDCELSDIIYVMLNDDLSEFQYMVENNK